MVAIVKNNNTIYIKKDGFFKKIINLIKKLFKEKIFSILERDNNEKNHISGNNRNNYYKEKDNKNNYGGLRRYCISFIEQKKSIIKNKFPNIDFDLIISGEIGEYDEKKDELIIENIIFGNGYIKYSEFKNQKPIFYLFENPEKTIIKLNKDNLNGSPDIELNFNNGKKVKLSFRDYKNYINCLDILDSKLYLYKNSEEILVNKDEAIKEISDILSHIEKDYHFSGFEKVF